MFENAIGREFDRRNQEYNDLIISRIATEAKKICRRVTLEMFSDQADTYLDSYPFTEEVRTLGKRLKDSIRLAAEERFAEKAETLVTEFISSEAFLDSIIQRIKDKQL